MNCPLCGGNIVEFSSKVMDGCVLVCTKCKVSSPYAETTVLAELSFELIRKEGNKKKADFEFIDFGERSLNLNGDGMRVFDNTNLTNMERREMLEEALVFLGKDVTYDKEPEGE